MPLRATGTQRSGTGADMAAPQTPIATVIILNLGKIDLTQRCVDTLQRWTTPGAIEVLVIDNGGSSDEALSLQARLGASARVVRLGVNRYFGEANNIGAEIATGQHLVFLNNDAFVTEGWLDAMLAVLSDTAGVVVPMFLNADGSCQERGAAVLPDGSSLAYGRLLEVKDEDLTEAQIVQFGSAACMLVRRSQFLALGGFSHRYEPAYYEDADLCLRYKLAGLETVCTPAARVIHLENRTSLTPGLFGRNSLHDITEINRDRFLQLWAPALSGDIEAMRTRFSPLLPTRPMSMPTGKTVGRDKGLRDVMGAWVGRKRPRIRVQLPEPVVLGSALLRQLQIAHALAGKADVVLCARYPVSRMRLQSLAAEMGTTLAPVVLMEHESELLPGEISTLVAVGDMNQSDLMRRAPRQVHVLEALLPDRAMASALLRWFQASVSTLVVETEAQRAALVAHAAGHPWPLPPVAVIGLDLPDAPGLSGPARDLAITTIVATGRFGAGPGRQRFDQLIEAARVLHDAGQSIAVRFVGSLPSSDDARQYYMALKARAKGLPITFHLDLPRPAYLSAIAGDVVWHAPADDLAGPSLGVRQAMRSGALLMVLAPEPLHEFGRDVPTCQDFARLAARTMEWATGRTAPPQAQPRASSQSVADAWCNVVLGKPT